MKLRKHRGDKTYKIMWQQRSKNGVPPVFKPDIIATGQNPTSVLNTFLWGRDRANITAIVWERHSGFPKLSKSGNAWFIMRTYEYGNIK